MPKWQNYNRRQRDMRMRTEARQARLAQAYRGEDGQGRRVNFVAVLELVVIAAAVLTIAAALVLYGHGG